MVFFLLKVGPPLEKFSGSAPVVHGVMQSIVRGIKIIDIHVAYVLACVIDIVVSHEKRFIFT